MALSPEERQAILDQISGYSDDDLAKLGGGTMTKGSSLRSSGRSRAQAAREAEEDEPPTTYGRRKGGSAETYMRGSKQKEEAKAAKIAELEGRLESGEFPVRDTRAKTEARLTELKEPNKRGRRYVDAVENDKGGEDGLSMAEAVEKKIREGNIIEAYDGYKDRGDGTPLARLDREAEAGFAQADQKLADADAARMREGEEAFAAESDRQRASQMSDERKARNDRASLARLDREAEAGFAQAEEMLAEDQAALADRDRASQMSEERRARNERAAKQGSDLQDEAMSLFPKIMGSSFNPKSSMDKGKLEAIMQAKRDNPDLSPNQLALKIYKDYMS